MELKNKSLVIAGLTSVLLMFFFGIPTALLPSGLFIRMVPATALDYFFLAGTSVLLGGYFGLQFYKKSGGAKEDLAALGGGLAGLFAFGCPICNALLASLMGTSALLTYYDPLRPFLGLLGIGLLGGAIYLKLRCHDCREV
jgi:hypothetical protein